MLELDAENQEIYWYDQENERIRKASMAGGSAVTVLEGRVRAFALGPEPLGDPVRGGDVNRSGVLDADDLVRIRYHLARRLELSQGAREACAVRDLSGSALSLD